MKTNADHFRLKRKLMGAAACFFGVIFLADAATIDFETIPGMENAIVPVPTESQLSDQFLSTLGVRFSSGSPYVAVVGLGEGHATSGINGIGGTTPGGLLTYDGAFPIVATFFDPNNPTVPATTDFVSLRIDLVPTSALNIRLDAFDVNARLIGSFTTVDSSGALLQVAVAGIHSVQFVGTVDNSGAAVDDFTFNSVVPVTDLSSVDDLITTVSGSNLLVRQKRPLLATLEAAKAAYGRDDVATGINQLQAFQNKVEVQVRRLDPVLADALIAAAQAIIDSAASE
jgi:hypothetical protein